MKTKINKEVWKSSSINYLNTLASDVNELREKVARVSNLYVNNDFKLDVCADITRAKIDYQKALKHFWKEYVRILNEWNEINKKEVE